MKTLTCHCGGVEAEIKPPENGFEKFVKCNCSICKRKGYIMTPIKQKSYAVLNPNKLPVVAYQH